MKLPRVLPALSTDSATEPESFAEFKSNTSAKFSSMEREESVSSEESAGKVIV